MGVSIWGRSLSVAFDGTQALKGREGPWERLRSDKQRLGEKEVKAGKEREEEEKEEEADT